MLIQFNTVTMKSWVSATRQFDGRHTCLILSVTPIIECRNAQGTSLVALFSNFVKKCQAAEDEKLKATPVVKLKRLQAIPPC